MSAPEKVSIVLPEGALAGWSVLVACLREAEERTGYHMVFGGLVDQIERQIEPKPDEPKRLLAAVEDRAGARWVRWSYDSHTHCPWRNVGAVHIDTDDNRRWDELDIVAVITHGIDR